MSNELAIYKLSDMQTMADAVAKSGLFGMKSHDQALALMLVAQSEGQHPATITQDYDIIQNKACRKTHSVMARFQLMGGKVEWHQLTEAIADATFSHPSGGSLRMSWTIEQAKKAGLTNKDNWKNYPRAMLRARTIAEGVRSVYPAAIGGMMIAEEAQDLPARGEIEINPAPASVDAPISFYPSDDFDKNFQKWKSLVASGKQTPDDIIKKAQTRATLCDEHLAAIRALPTREPAVMSGDVMTEEEIQAAQARELEMENQ